MSRYDAIKRLNLCVNCLRGNHITRDCKSSNCLKCGKHHNTLLHRDDVANEEYERRNEASHENQTAAMHCIHEHDTHVFLSTALVDIIDNQGNKHAYRALLDSGSQSNFISDRVCKQLKIKRQSVDVSVNGINQMRTNLNHQVQVSIKSKHDTYTTSISCLVLPRITGQVPAVRINAKHLVIPKDIHLADPTFHVPGDIDLLLGASIFYDLLQTGRYRSNKNEPSFQQTRLGWVLTGSITTNHTRSSQEITTMCSFNELSNQLKKFWELEAISQAQNYSSEEQQCEDLFVNSVVVQQTHYVVQLPLKENATQLGESKTEATRRFLSLERRLQRTPSLRTEYQSFMAEYEKLGHMTEVPESKQDNKINYYMPHHAVVKDDSDTTKVRVVFDASAKTSSGLSLNDVLMVGPTIQHDLFSIMIRFRSHRFVITADIEKMYRQIFIAPEHRNFQTILWRADSTMPLKSYQLNTVTYGTASAPFQAIRGLHEVANEHVAQYPSACNSIKTDFYVDDWISGTDSIEEMQTLIQDVTSILNSRGFNLRKFRSNVPNILDSIVSNKSVSHLFNITNQEKKTLGLLWDSNLDILKYAISINKTASRTVTKRTILSSIAQIFDPLGLIAPITIKAKLILQQLWQLKIDWDDEVPDDLSEVWSNFMNNIQHINDLNIERSIISNKQRIELHGFSDASEAAYGACLYIRSTSETGQHTVRLLCAKSKVAPLKIISLPRLELCGALLLAQLINRIKQALGLNFNQTFLWCDSTIALAWIAGPPNRWKTFVSNRVTEIQELTEDARWYHISTFNNPADLLSRGVSPGVLKENELWWNGPSWLTQHHDDWPQSKQSDLQELPERRKTKLALVVTNQQVQIAILEKYSSIIKLINVVAYCLRFKLNSLSAPEDRKGGMLTVVERNKALQNLVKIAQQEFQEDLDTLRKRGIVEGHSKLLTLNPFLDQDDVIRVGGRLKHSNLSYDQKYPIILPNKHRLTELLIQQEHESLLHAGPQAVLASIRQSYWPIHGLTAVKRITHQCVTCFRNKPRQTVPIMGNLPAHRVIPARPFLNCGIDYAGPIQVKEGKTRGRKIIKTYICLFVCFATKAVHIELVSDLTTNSFLNALKRFIARRGKCLNLYTDNATNFVGADRELRTIAINLAKEEVKNEVSRFLSNNQITWHFIPARSPHMGGLWEAAIKSAKYHLKRIIGDAALTFEDLYTILTQIESCLNSRPITPLSNDPNDLLPLTPGHFLIADSFTSLPQEDVKHIACNRLSHYQRLQQLFQQFWSRWQSEYLSQLQQRSKWQRHHNAEFSPGSLVIVHESGLPPFKWRMGRIIDTHPGSDGVIRVVSVQVNDGVVKRSVQKVFVLPID